jgi:hypothetical protein
VSSTRGATLSSDDVEAARFGVLAEHCPTCGALDILWKGRRLMTVHLSAAKTTTRVTRITDLSGAGAGRLMLRVASRGKRVTLDGVAVAHP